MLHGSPWVHMWSHCNELITQAWPKGFWRSSRVAQKNCYLWANPCRLFVAHFYPHFPPYPPFAPFPPISLQFSCFPIFPQVHYLPPWPGDSGPCNAITHVH